MLDEIRVKCREILDSTSRFDRSNIFDISSLACHFDYMEIHRRSMLRWFERYESWKRQSKKGEAWSRMRSEIYALDNLATMSPPIQ
jgi:hypothetical protein